ncbi:MAG: ATP-binding protein, partial [Thermoanaerobaculia bacterium]
CVFATHDVTRDPPYSKIDLVTCCNVLIYFDAELQKKAVALLQYALAPGGFLMLGSSENLRGMSNQVEPVSTKPLIYRKQDSANHAALETKARSPERVVLSSAPPLGIAGRRSQDEDAFLAAHLAPCGVLVNAQMEITRIRGEISAFVSMEPGDATLNLIRLLNHQELVAELRLAIRTAFRDRETVITEGTVVNDGEARRLISFEVVPYAAAPPSQSLCWVLFRSSAAPTGAKAGGSRKRTETDGLRHALAAAIEDRRQLGEDAAAAAEDAQSSDEELRSTNEELETAKEELQSANEELNTLNDELQLRNHSLGRINDDIENLLGAVEVPILFVGVDLTVRRYNVTAGMLLNLRPDSTGRPLRDSKSILDVALLEKLVGAVMETGVPADVEVQDGAGEWRLLRIRVYRTHEGAVDGAIVAVVDINLLKRSVLAAEAATRAATMLAEASALLASSLDYETTLESLARLSTKDFADWCAVDLVNDDGSIRHLTVSHTNPVMRDLALQFQQASFSEGDRAPGAPRALRLRESVLLGDLAESELTGIPPEARITQLIGALGVRSLISVPLIVRDKVLGTTTFSTSRRRYEPVDLQLAEELSQRAALAIDTALLFRDAENANRYKDQFLGTVAHELRTPLTSILGWVQLAEANPDMRDDALERVAESAEVLRLFTEDLLDVTRIRERKMSLELADIDLADVIASAIDMTTHTAAARQIQLDVNVIQERALVRGDRVRLLQVVWNLLSNAIKFTPSAGRIEVRLEREENAARLCVHDNGEGISPDLLPHVFELYRQGDQVVSGTPGLGIGLSIVAEIVKLHRGTVNAESRGIGYGSTFIVTLPMLDAGPAEATVLTSKKPS